MSLPPSARPSPQRHHHPLRSARDSWDHGTSTRSTSVGSPTPIRTIDSRHHPRPLPRQHHHPRRVMLPQHPPGETSCNSALGTPLTIHPRRPACAPPHRSPLPSAQIHGRCFPPPIATASRSCDSTSTSTHSGVPSSMTSPLTLP
uniref:Uncharacterized protein n=1 Tax=Zea mays TaxID=4577 RepID=A0A804UBG5_MAIZE